MDDDTLQFYRRNAEAYAGWAKAPSTRLVGFLAMLPEAGSILELGCGAGNHSKEMLSRGFRVRATDGSPEMAEIAAKRLNHPVEAMLFDELDERDAYDGVWASACLLHVPRDELAGILTRIHRALKPEGLFYASYKVGHGDGRDSPRPLLQLSPAGMAGCDLRRRGSVDVGQIRHQRDQELRRGAGNHAAPRHAQRCLFLILRSGVSRVSKDEATERAHGSRRRFAPPLHEGESEIKPA